MQLKMKVEMMPLGIGVCNHLLVCIPLQYKAILIPKSFKTFIRVNC